MKAQISRLSDRPSENFGGVYQQQGRMITDADWNELVDVIKRRQRQATAKTVGSGVPRDGGVLDISESRSAPGQVDRSAALRFGSVVVNGIHAEVASTGPGGNFDYQKQRFFPEPPPAADPNNLTYYVDLWERLVVSIEDPELRDPALHGADTCVRTQVMAQVKHVVDAADVDDPDANPAIGDAVFDLTRSENVADPDDPCAVVTSLSDVLGNYLFRLEVHDVDGTAKDPKQVILKWSLENAAEAHSVDQAPQEFRDGDWVFEFFDEVTEQHLGVHLNAGPVRRSHLEFGGYPAAVPKDPGGKAYPLVRRWDGYCRLEQSGGNWSLAAGQHLRKPLEGAGADPISAGGELELRLGDLILSLSCGGRRFVAGDFWLALARQHGGNGGVEVASATPVGICHHYLKLMTVAGGNVTYPIDAADAVRRLSFPPLSDLTADRVGYDPSVTEARWKDINEEEKSPLPLTVQDAIDQLAGNVGAGDVNYELPSCDSTYTVGRLLGDLANWPDVDRDERNSVKDMLDAFICHLDAARIPYSTEVPPETAATIRDWLDTLREDVDDRVKIAGDTMTGDLAVLTRVGVGIDRIGGTVPGGKVHIKDGEKVSGFGAIAASIEIDLWGDKTSILQANGNDGAYRIAIQDGSGRVGHTWNAHDKGPNHGYDKEAEGASWLRFHGGEVSIRTAAGGAAGESIKWNLGITQDQAGNVGIKTQPKYDLDVAGTAKVDQFLMQPGGQAGYVLTSDNGGRGTWQPPSPLGWGLKAGVLSTDAATVTKSVAVGTPMSVSGRLTVRNDSVGQVGIESISDGVNSHVPWSDGEVYLTGDRRPGATGSGDFHFRVYNGSSYSSRFIIKGNNGRVGIGTTTPGQALHVVGDIEYGQLRRLDVAEQFTARIRAADLTLGHSTRRGTPGRALVDYKTSSGTKQLRLNYGTDWQGVRYFGNFGPVSSRRHKKDIEDLTLEDCRSILGKLNPVTYRLKESEGDDLQLGFIAEDAPEQVTDDDRDVIYYNHIVAALVRVVNDQSAAIARLEKALKRLEASRSG